MIIQISSSISNPQLLQAGITALYASRSDTSITASFAPGMISSSYAMNAQNAYKISGSAVDGAVTSSLTASLAYTSSVSRIAGNRTFAPISGTHGTAIWWIPNAVHSSAFGTVGPNFNTLYFFPFVAPCVGTASIHTIGVYLTAGAAAGDQCSIAIYNGHAEDLHPSDFITASLFNLDVTGIRSASLDPPLRLMAGRIYWIGMHQNNGSTFRSIVENTQIVLGTLDFSAGGTVNCYTSASDWGASSSYVPQWPSDAHGAVVTPTTIEMPVIGFMFGT